MEELVQLFAAHYPDISLPLIRSAAIDTVARSSPNLRGLLLDPVSIHSAMIASCTALERAFLEGDDLSAFRLVGGGSIRQAWVPPRVPFVGFPRPLAQTSPFPDTVLRAAICARIAANGQLAPPALSDSPPPVGPSGGFSLPPQGRPVSLSGWMEAYRRAHAHQTCVMEALKGPWQALVADKNGIHVSDHIDFGIKRAMPALNTFASSAEVFPQA